MSLRTRLVHRYGRAIRGNAREVLTRIFSTKKKTKQKNTLVTPSRIIQNDRPLTPVVFGRRIRFRFKTFGRKTHINVCRRSRGQTAGRERGRPVRREKKEKKQSTLNGIT